MLNLAAADSDALAGAIVASGNGGLATGLSPCFGGVQPGGVVDIANLAVETTSLGVNSEQFTFTPYDINASGYVAIMAPETVTDAVYPLV